MRSLMPCLAVILVLGCLFGVPVFTEDSPAAAAVVEAAPDASSAAPAAEKPTEPTISEQISADLIDLTALRAAAESQLSRETIRMSLQDAVQLALKQNSDIIITSFEPQKSDADLYTAKGEFDSGIQFKDVLTRTSATPSQQISAFVGALGGINQIQSTTTTQQVQWGGKLVYGTKYAVLFSIDKEQTSFGNGADFNSMLGFTLTQPIIRDSGRKLNEVRIHQAENARKLTAAQFQLSVMKTMGDVIKGYWDLVGAVEAVKVSEGSLKNAERLLQISETRRRIGMAADIEVLQAKAGVAVRQSEVIASSTRASTAGDLLKQILGMRDGEYFSKAVLVPTDRPNPDDKSLFDFNEYDKSLDASVKRALEHRPELTMSDMEIANAQLEEFRTDNAILPQLDLVAGYGQGGRDINLGTSISGIFDKKEFNYTYGIQGTIVIGNHAARGANLRARLTKRQAEERRKQIENQLMAAIHIAARAVKTNQILVESTKQAVRLQEANVTAEEKRLRLGITTSFQVLRIQEDLTSAQTQELQSRVSYEKSLVDLQQAEGVLLKNLGVDVEAPGGETPVPYWEGFEPHWK